MSPDFEATVKSQYESIVCLPPILHRPDAPKAGLKLNFKDYKQSTSITITSSTQTGCMPIKWKKAPKKKRNKLQIKQEEQQTKKKLSNMTKPKNGKIRSSCQSAPARHGITHCLAIPVNELSNKLTKALSSRKKTEKF
uniref:Uncharacterized protein n=1 Tax=Glossina pallidipes TaxID=7398 RepID=A0A1A9ZJF0_GLOPL